MNHIYYNAVPTYTFTSNVNNIGYATNTNVSLKANVVDLTTANVTELTNLYFTNTRSRAAISVGSGGSYDNSTGIITITGGFVASSVTVFPGHSGNVDYGDDVVIRGAFANSLAKNSRVPILWQHQMSEPLGKVLTMYEDDKGLYIKAKLPKEDTLVSGRIIPQMRIGSIQEMSIGFFTKNYDIAKDGIRLLKEIDLFEVSLVTKAMNSQALVTGFKSFETLRDIEQTLKDNGFSNTEAKTLISKIKEFSSKRDASQDNQRDADATKQKIITDLNNFINNLKK